MRHWSREALTLLVLVGAELLQAPATAAGPAFGPPPRQIFVPRSTASGTLFPMERPMSVLGYLSTPAGVEVRWEAGLAAAVCAVVAVWAARRASVGWRPRARKTAVGAVVVAVLAAAAPQVIHLLVLL
jgi:hypothetical protein